MCLHPVPTKRRDTQGRLIYRPCGDCVECSQQQTNSWFVRLREESKQHRYMLFVTYKYPNTFLSYKHVKFVNNDCDFFNILKKYFCEHPSKSLQYNLSHENVFNRYLNPEKYVDTGVFVPVLSKPDVSAHIKRVRRQYQYHFNKTLDIKYFIQGEYGSLTFRPHWHGLIFLNEHFAQVKDLIYNDWLSHFSDVNHKDAAIDIKEIDLSDRASTDTTIEYVAKYVCKHLDEQTPYVQAGYIQKPPRVMSKGIGNAYFEKLMELHPDLRRQIENVQNFEEFKVLYNKFFFIDL